MDNYYTAVAVAAARRHRRIEASRRHRVRPGIDQALEGVCQANRVMTNCVMADCVAARKRACAEMADAAVAKERACAEMRSRQYVNAVVAASKADADAAAAEAEEWGEPSAEAVAAADAAVLGPELTDMVNFVAGNDAPAVLRWMATNDASQLPAGWTVTVTVPPRK